MTSIGSPPNAPSAPSAALTTPACEHDESTLTPRPRNIHSKRRPALVPQPVAIRLRWVSKISSVTVSVNSFASLPSSMERVSLCVCIQAPAGLKTKASDTALYVLPPVCPQTPRLGENGGGDWPAVVAVSVPPLAKVDRAGKLLSGSPV